VLFQLVLQVGPGRADPARARRASGLNFSGRASTNFFRAGLKRAHILKRRPSTALKHDGLASGRAGPDPARNLQHYVEPKSRGRRNRGAWLQLVVYGRRNRGAPPLEFTSAHEKPSSSIAILLGHSSFQEFCRSQRKESFGLQRWLQLVLSDDAYRRLALRSCIPRCSPAPPLLPRRQQDLPPLLLCS
jgi:hypothetical protein